jgi:hypothetical protein
MLKSRLWGVRCACSGCLKGVKGWISLVIYKWTLWLDLATLLTPHSLAYTSRELRYTLHSLATFGSSIGWDYWRVSTTFASSFLHIVALVGCMGWWSSCYSWWLPSPSRPGDWRDRWAALVIVVGSNNQAIVRGSCTHPHGRSWRASLVESWLVGVHNLSGSWGTLGGSSLSR